MNYASFLLHWPTPPPRFPPAWSATRSTRLFPSSSPSQNHPLHFRIRMLVKVAHPSSPALLRANNCHCLTLVLRSFLEGDSLRSVFDSSMPRNVHEATTFPESNGSLDTELVFSFPAFGLARIRWARRGEFFKVSERLKWYINSSALVCLDG